MTKINAMAALEPNGKLKDFSYESNDLEPQDVLVKNLHCGICYSDVHMIKNDWYASEYPLIPGHEVIGEVIELGSAVTHLKKGVIVGIGWQKSSCGKCKFCLSGNENICFSTYPERQATIIKNHGGFSSHMVFDSRFAFPIPKNVELKKTAPLLCGGITVYSALKEAGMTSGQSIGVIGMGGLGHMAVQFASKLGNDVTVFSRTDNKTELSHKLGANQVVITKDEIPKKLDERLDIIINTVDRPLEWNKYLRLLDGDGTLTFVGNPGKFELNVGELLGKRKRIMGSPIGGRARITEMLDIVSKYNIGAMIEEFPLSEVNQAIERLEKNNIRFRAVLNM